MKRVIMGLDRYTKTPCGFCFVEFHHRESTEDALRLISGCKLDERIIRVGEAPTPSACAPPPTPTHPPTHPPTSPSPPPPPPLTRHLLAQTGTAGLSKGGSTGGAALVGRCARATLGSSLTRSFLTRLDLRSRPHPSYLLTPQPHLRLQPNTLTPEHPNQVREEYRGDFDAGRGGWGLADQQPAQPLHPPRRRSFDPASQRGPRESGGHAPELASIAQGHRGDDPPAKRSKPAEVKNQRFREEKDDDDDDDD